jgi:NAD(P)H-nitrite reductase large subunit
VGGCGSRHPRIAKTVTEHTDVEGVLKILEKAMEFYREAEDKGNKLSFHEVMEKCGIDRLRSCGEVGRILPILSHPNFFLGVPLTVP